MSRNKNPNGVYLDSIEVRVACFRARKTVTAALKEARINPSSYRQCTYGLLSIDYSRIETFAAIIGVTPNKIIATKRPQPPNRSEHDANQESQERDLQA